MLLNDDIVDTEKPGVILSPTFAVDEFLGLLLHPSTFTSINQDGLLMVDNQDGLSMIINGLLDF